LAGFSIHDALECYRLLLRQIARPRTIEDLVHIGRGALVIVGDPIPVTRQPPASTFNGLPNTEGIILGRQKEHAMMRAQLTVQTQRPA
jgi:hypothetical protein